jgi:hypothetical protein
VNRDQFNETRLRERKQGPEESTVEFFYDVLDLCGKVDPNMAEQLKLQHLWRRIKPSLVEKFWSMKPATTDEFLTEVKRYRNPGRNDVEIPARGIGNGDVGQADATSGE